MTSQAIKLSSHERDAVPFSHILPCNLNGTAPVWILPAQTGGNGGMGHCEVEFDPMKFSSERFFRDRGRVSVDYRCYRGHDEFIALIIRPTWTWLGVSTPELSVLALGMINLQSVGTSSTRAGYGKIVNIAGPFSTGARNGCIPTGTPGDRHRERLPHLWV